MGFESCLVWVMNTESPEHVSGFLVLTGFPTGSRRRVRGTYSAEWVARGRTAKKFERRREFRVVDSR